MYQVTRKPDLPALVISAGLLVLAVIVGTNTLSLQITSTYGLGPKAMPLVVAGILALLAIGNAAAAWRGDFPARDSYDPQAVLMILGGLAALIVIIGLGGGFIIATTILFTATAAGFGRRALGKDIAIGLVLAVVVYLIFDKVLTLSLPAGPIERLL